KQITDLTGQAKTLQDKLDALKEEISKLGNLQVMYSNSIDFGDYDYSGNPNLAIPINKTNVKRMNPITTNVTLYDSYAGIQALASGGLSVGFGLNNSNTGDFSKLTVGKTYTLTIPIRINSDFDGDVTKIITRLRCLAPDNTAILLFQTTLPKDIVKGKFVDVSTTFTVPTTTEKSWSWYVHVTSTADLVYNGSFDVGYNIKLEEGSKATPYQPNLLDAPYYLSKVALGENIANKTIKYPIKTSAYAVYTGPNTEPYIAGQKYTLTMKATKPATQTFNVFLDAGTIGVGSMTPVDGLTDVWQKTFTVSQSNIDAGVKDRLTIYQVPNSSVGAVQIDWLKIEKGDTRTPNIEQYKYRGIGMRDSNNPKDCVWDLAPEYVEDNLATDVKISEITGKVNNYTDGKVSEINSQLTASINEVDKKVTANTKSITTINSTLTEMQKPVKYEAWFSGGTELRPANANSRFRVSEERLTIGTKLNVAMNESPLEWNADRWEATFTRECSILVDVQTMVEFADQWGTYVYINMWKDTNQTQTWDTGYGMGIASGANFWFRTELSVSMYCMNAKVGDKFSIGLGMASGKSLTSARIHKLHIMEL
ncbi:hypothetical protein, partial [Enterococcus faecium]|uniref:hypothetical protein n=1 Tax=Enterococcus faecium TaxID=1352 RepID=UPI0017861DA3